VLRLEFVVGLLDSTKIPKDHCPDPDSRTANFEKFHLAALYHMD